MCIRDRDPYALETACISIITYDKDVKQILPLTELENLQLPEIACPEAGPVSYTHLKRFIRACICWFFIACVLPFKIPPFCWNYHVPPVSYTHLDVYKRQPWAFLFMVYLQSIFSNIFYCNN